jgi:benzoyl-CoA-dihydrodiol lyase
MSNEQPVEFRTRPEHYRHWRLEVEAPVARLILDVDENGGYFGGYELKQNSYDVGVDIELADAINRVRFEHPSVRVLILSSAKDNLFCAGANIRMLARASHAHKVNFCKFTNETRIALEDASAIADVTSVAALSGTAAGGGYELALAADHIVLIDDGSAAVSLPEVPTLAVLPGTGGLTRLTDKRKVRRDLADVFSTLEEGVRGERAVAWRLVDETVPRSQFAERIEEFAALGRNEAVATGITLTPLEKSRSASGIEYPHLQVDFDRVHGVARFEIRGPEAAEGREDAGFWPLALCRALDDAVLDLRFNEPELGTWVFTSRGDSALVASYDARLEDDGWFAREVVGFIKRTLWRLDVSARTLVTLVEPDSCFVGFLAELVFAADRSYMLDAPETSLALSSFNFGALPTYAGVSRLVARFYGDPEGLRRVEQLVGQLLDAQTALAAELVTFAPDDIDWDDEIRLLLEERASFSPDALTAMEANLRFPGPETMETKIFSRLSAWQNWIFQRPNAVGESGALPLYGTGQRPDFDKTRT